LLKEHSYDSVDRGLRHAFVYLARDAALSIVSSTYRASLAPARNCASASALIRATSADAL